jgi:exopolyphosphatase/guanosine-5'-triphosphate,3'-diphosphate pyrophosphatase
LDVPHGVLTAKLAGQLFDQTATLHGLGEEDRLLLELAALLHDIGHLINTIEHDKHGYYILKANALIGLTGQQQDVVAQLVLHHRVSSSSFEEEAFRALPQKQRISVEKLTALLRLADGLDVRHASQVTAASLFEKNSHWSLVLHGRGDLMIEKWALSKRRSLFETTFGVPVELEEGDHEE